MFDKERFLNSLNERVYVSDGSMGALLQTYGFSCSSAELNLLEPKIVGDVLKKYCDAGSDMVYTNTFIANRLKLEPLGLADKTKEINNASLRLAREACPSDCIIVGDIGPLNDFIYPVGKISFDEAVSCYKEQVNALLDADLLVIETVSDIKTMKAALIAARELFDKPVIASMTFQDKRATTGTDPETFAVIADTLGADLIGANCSDGPDGLYETVKILSSSTNKPLSIKPNAGIPKVVDGKTVWDYPYDKFADYGVKFVNLGAAMVGGCCGTNPEYIKALASAVYGLKPAQRNKQPGSRLCSRTKTVLISPTMIVGERINPTNRKGFIEEIKKSQTNYIRNQAIQQVSEGANLIDINVGVPGTDEVAMLKLAVETVQGVTDAPIVIDTSNLAALEEALKVCDGKPLINSVNGSEKSLNGVLPLAKKYGAAVIGLCVDENGIPQTADDRVKIAKRIIDAAESFGIWKEDIFIDCVVLSLATNPDAEKIILDTVKEIKKMGYKTILGISNISHGLPKRNEINAKFFTKACEAGLDLAILNPLDNIIHKDTSINVDFSMDAVDYSSLPVEKKLFSAILYGDRENVAEHIDEGLMKLSAMEVNNILVSAMSDVGRKFEAKEYFLPQVLASARAMKTAFERLKRELRKEGHESKGKVLFATVENDVHDIGKNIVIALLESNDFEVVDLGVNVKAKEILRKALEIKPNAIALSALMTTTVFGMEEVINGLKEGNINIPVIVGGAVVDEDYAKSIHCHYGRDALSAVAVIEGIINNEKNKRTA